MTRFILGFALLSFSANAVYEIGDVPRNACWTTVTRSTSCLNDPSLQYQVRVLLFNSGWCGPCKAEFQEIASKTNEFEGLPVTFLSLSAAGWNRTDLPSPEFLTGWQNMHRLQTAKASFIVAASPRDAGKDYFASVFIPNVVILDSNGVVVYKAVNPGVDAIVREVRKVTPRPMPVPVPVR
jgi:thiol-disulfide isomerase/thioredoxin